MLFPPDADSERIFSPDLLRVLVISGTRHECPSMLEELVLFYFWIVSVIRIFVIYLHVFPMNSNFVESYNRLLIHVFYLCIVCIVSVVASVYSRWWRRWWSSYAVILEPYYTILQNFPSVCMCSII